MKTKHSRVLLIELNEITWDLIDPLIARGKLPTFELLKREGAWGTPVSVDLPPQLDPWITWTTVYTGRPQADHNVYYLEQPPESIRARRLWEICHDSGLSVGVFGSLCSWPPQEVRGFYVPDTFAPDPSTYPHDLRPIQELNLTYTRAARLPSDRDGLFFKAGLGLELVKLGLRPATILRIARQLARERIDGSCRWRRVALQPLVNFDLFSVLYRRYRPAFASFHSNHVAHYMHTYWKAMQPEAFDQPATEEEVKRYGGAIEHGYRTADELLGRVLALCGDDTTIIIASSMGQKPYESGLKGGKPICQLRSLDRLLELLGASGRVRALATMSDQFNIYSDSAQTRSEIASRLRAAYVDSPDQPLFHVLEHGDGLTVNIFFHEGVSEESRCHFPHEGADSTHRYGDLVYNTGMVKSGCHDPRGMLILYGAGIVAGGRELGPCNNLDLAPTILELLQLPIPSQMSGRVLSEALVAHRPILRRAASSGKR